jgi:hypothetical protein
MRDEVVLESAFGPVRSGVVDIGPVRQLGGLIPQGLGAGAIVGGDVVIGVRLNGAVAFPLIEQRLLLRRDFAVLVLDQGHQFLLERIEIVETRRRTAVQQW